MKKKLLIIAAVICLAFSLFACGGSKKQDAYVGEWDIIEMSSGGVTFTADQYYNVTGSDMGYVEFNSDGTCMFEIAGQVLNCDWKLDRDTLKIDDGTMTITGEKNNDGSIKLTAGSTTLTIKPAEGGKHVSPSGNSSSNNNSSNNNSSNNNSSNNNSGATVSEAMFVGTWDLTSMTSEGTTVTASQYKSATGKDMGNCVFNAGSKCTMKIGDNSYNCTWEVSSNGDVVITDNVGDKFTGTVESDGSISFTNGRDTDFVLEKASNAV